MTSCDLGSCSNVPPPPKPRRPIQPYVWGRVYDANGNPTWVQVSTDSAGFSDYLYITALIQCCKLNLAESPFWTQFGLPAHQSVVQQLPPDYNIQFIAQYFMSFFASLIVTRAPPSFVKDLPNQNTGPYSKVVTGFPLPRYFLQILRRNGSIFQALIGT